MLAKGGQARSARIAWESRALNGTAMGTGSPRAVDVLRTQRCLWHRTALGTTESWLTRRPEGWPGHRPYRWPGFLLYGHQRAAQLHSRLDQRNETRQTIKPFTGSPRPNTKPRRRSTGLNFQNQRATPCYFMPLSGAAVLSPPAKCITSSIWSTFFPRFASSHLAERTMPLSLLAAYFSRKVS